MAATGTGPATLSFRRAGGADVAAVVALVESAYRGEASRAGWTTEADLLDGRRTSADEVSQLLAADDGLILLALDAQPSGTGELLACAHLQQRGAEAWFGMFAVQPRLQGSGIGGRVLAEAERIARKDWQCGAMRMTVITLREELLGWYVRRGYVRTGALKPFPYGDARFGLPRRTDLQFEVLHKPLAQE